MKSPFLLLSRYTPHERGQRYTGRETVLRGEGGEESILFPVSHIPGDMSAHIYTSIPTAGRPLSLAVGP